MPKPKYQLLLEQLIRYCSQEDRRLITLEECYKFILDTDRSVIYQGRTNRTNKEAGIRADLQTLRDKGHFDFKDNKGSYFYQGVFLQDEHLGEDFPIDDAFKHNSEHYKETVYARDRGVVLQAKTLHDRRCLVCDCKNTFVMNTGLRYIEVHHIKPLFQGGADEMPNLATLCAHHHKMSHFGEQDLRDKLEHFLLKKVDSVLQAKG